MIGDESDIIVLKPEGTVDVKILSQIFEGHENAEFDSGEVRVDVGDNPDLREIVENLGDLKVV